MVKYLLSLLILLLPFSSLWGDEAFEIKGSSHRQIQICRQWLGEITRELREKLGLSLDGKITIIFVDTKKKFRSLYLLHSGSTPPDWALAVAFSQEKLILIKAYKLGAFTNNLLATLRHEILHIALVPLVIKSEMPLYFNEGLAMEFSLPLLDFEAQKKVESAARSGTLIPFQKLTRNFPPHSFDASLAYIQSHHFILYLIRQYDRAKLKALLALMVRGYTFEYSLKRAYGQSSEELEKQWKASLKKDSWHIFFLFEDLTLFAWLGLIVVLGVIRLYFKNRKILKKWNDEEGE